MPPEAVLPAARPATARVPAAWRLPLLRLALAWAVLIALARADWSEMVRQWWDASTYNHILLVPPILAWLVRQRSDELARLVLLAWLAGTAAGINLVGQFGAVVMLQAAVAVLLGPRVAAGLLFPLGYMLFLVPFGDEIVPALQAITAKLAVALTHLSGVPAQIDGVFIDTPAGLFEVAEACSGVKFFSGWKRRALFMAAAVTVPVLANGVRAWGTIYVAQSQGIEFAAGFDHIVYGWIFFALVMTAVLGASWRFFDRSPDDPLIDAAALEASPLVTGLERFSVSGWRAMAAVLAFAAAGAWMDRIALVP